MTKDSGLTANADWITADASAGRLLSGSVDQFLAEGDVLKVYSNGTYLGEAQINGTQWAITDPNGYSGNWTYTANVVTQSGVLGQVSSQVVTADLLEAPPAITSVTDALNTSLVDAASTAHSLSSVSGTGTVGSTVYLYDNSVMGTDGMLTGTVPAAKGMQTLYQVPANSVWVVAGQKYEFSFNYVVDEFGTQAMVATIDGVAIKVPGKEGASPNVVYTTGTMTATYTANESKYIDIKFTANNNGYSTGKGGDYWLDDITFKQLDTQTNTLVANTVLGGATPLDDNLSYSTGPLDALEGNDIITATSKTLAATLAAGGRIDGGAGLDTLKLAPETQLNLANLTSNQTVKSIQEVEVIEMQGGSLLTLPANDVMSLGGTGFSNLSFASTAQTAYGSVEATGSISSTGKVQFFVNGTISDTLWLKALNTDGVVGANGQSGNAGLAGQWDYMGATSLTVNGVTQSYKVYDHSTTQAQALVEADVNVVREYNLVTITGVKASGTTTKVITETFDSLPYTNIAMDSFTTNNGLTFKQDILLPTFTIGADGTGVNGVGRALIMNNVNLPGAGMNQWSLQSPAGVTQVSADYWDLNTGGTPQLFLGSTGSNMAAGGTAAAPMSVTSTSTTAGLAAFGFAGQPNDKYFVDNLQVRLEGLAETTDVVNGGVTRFTTGTVNGTLTAPLLAGQYLEVFSNGVSLGNATVNGISWSIADTIAASGEAYTAKIMNADGSQFTASSSYGVNQAPSTTPKLTISDDMSGTVATGVSVNDTFQFDQAVTGFDASDILVSNGGVKGPLIQLDAKTWVMSVNTPNTGAGVTEVAVADGSFSATTGGSSGMGHSNVQAYDASLTQYVFDQFGNGAATGNASSPITSGAGDDFITTIGKSTDGVEVINTGAGNDILQIQASNITKLAVTPGATAASFNGGAGVDTLRLFQVTTTALTLDLTNTNVGLNLKNFESVDITGTANNVIKLNLNSVLNMSDIPDNPDTPADEGNMLVINGNAGDVVQLVGGINWTTVTSNASGSSLADTYGAAYHFVPTDTYRELSFGGATLFIDQATTLSNV